MDGRLHKLPLTTLLTALAVGCSSGHTLSKSSSPSIAPGSDGKSAPATVQPAPGPTLGSPAAAGNAVGSGPVAATYLAKAQASGIDLCSGLVKMQVDLLGLSHGATNFFQIPSSAVQCALIGNLNIASLLAAFNKGNGQPASKSDIQVDAAVIDADTLGGFTYKPPRPLLPAVFSASPEQLKSLHLSRDLTATSSDGHTYQGSIQVDMQSYDVPFTLPGSGKVYPHTLDFTIKTTGFDGIDRLAVMLPDSLEMRLSLDPLAILGVVLKGSVQEVISAASSGAQGVDPKSFAGGVLGVVSASVGSSPATLTLDLTDAVVSNSAGSSASP